jgi:hypothetical protein
MFLLSLFCLDTANAQVAITEFVNDTLGDENTDEWVEIYNYGTTSVDLSGWTIVDADTDAADIPAFTLAPGAFAILTEDPAAFIADWAVGVSGVDVITVAIGSLANTGDEIILRDAAGADVWSLAYADDDVAGYATHLSDLDVQQSVHGDKTTPGVVRDGDDNGVLGYLGYESGSLLNDPEAFLAANGDMGSPLAGNYGATLPMPELVVTGACPGAPKLNFANMTPGGTVVVLSANNLGNRALSSGACAGTTTGLGAGLKIRKTTTANANGAGSVNTPQLAAGACGAPVQILDVATCTLTNVDAL